MANTTVACTNINLLKESQIPASPSQNELYAAELDGKPATETQLTGKANTDLSNVLNNIDFVVESKYPTASDPTWYRVYKSGWVEQGQNNTLHSDSVIQNLPIQMADTNYSLQITAGQLGDWYLSGYDKSTTGFTYRVHTRNAEPTGVIMDWIVTGMKASE